MSEFTPVTVVDIFNGKLLSLLRWPTYQGALIYGVWVLWLYLCTHLVPGEIRLGLPLENGGRLRYKINGFRIVGVTLVTYFVCVWLGLLSPTLIYDNYAGLISFVFWLCVVLSIYLYISAHITKRVSKHITGNFIIDFWLGVELNPRLGGLDLKFFALRPGMMGWLMILLSIASRQYQVYGTIKLPMLLQIVMSGIYVLDYFWFEPLMLSTWDIIAENWGFQLVFGDLWFIPFAFSFSSFYLIDYDLEYGIWMVAFNLALFALGYYIFRSANFQKDQFKQDPSKPIWGKKPETVGGKLLVSGWWGVVRKPNYTGDLLIAFSIGLPSGFSRIIPHFYFIYLLALLLHRQYRDDKRCASKYKELWVAYCKRVPHTFLPLPGF